MPYEWPLEPETLFNERFSQMLTQGIPEEDAHDRALCHYRHVGRRAGRLGV